MKTLAILLFLISFGMHTQELEPLLNDRVFHAIEVSVNDKGDSISLKGNYRIKWIKVKSPSKLQLAKFEPDDITFRFTVQPYKKEKFYLIECHIGGERGTLLYIPKKG